jgi:hypothetical protein
MVTQAGNSPAPQQILSGAIRMSHAHVFLTVDPASDEPGPRYPGHTLDQTGIGIREFCNIKTVVVHPWPSPRHDPDART